MPSISVSPSTYSHITLLSSAWSVPDDQVVARLLEAFQDGRRGEQPNQRNPDELLVSASYAGVNVNGIFHLSSGRLEVLDGPVAGRSFKTPSGAACAVVQVLNPRINPNRNGWTFWRDEEGDTLLVHRRYSR
jgi:hypothetical protein